MSISLRPRLLAMPEVCQFEVCQFEVYQSEAASVGDA